MMVAANTHTRTTHTYRQHMHTKNDTVSAHTEPKGISLFNYLLMKTHTHTHTHRPTGMWFFFIKNQKVQLAAEYA